MQHLLAGAVFVPGCLQSISAFSLSGEYNTQALQGGGLWVMKVPRAEVGALRSWLMRMPALGTAGLQDL